MASDNTSKRKSNPLLVIMKDRGGRPPKYAKEEDLIKAALRYFSLCDKAWQLPEKAGLCLALDISYETYSQYKNKRFPEAIKKFERYIESNWVRRLAREHPVGAIFYLKNAFKEHYRDSYSSDFTTGGKALPQPIYGGLSRSPEIPKHNSNKKGIPTAQAH